jgi:chromosome segregation ATPase
VIAEGNDTPGSDGPDGAEFAESGQRGRRGEGDLLAERRARRSIESGEHALTVRAEAAEATVRTLETHLASLQHRLQDSEQESRRVSELLDAAQAAREVERAELARGVQSPAGTIALERELQRASQREYAEQRLRIEAEERAAERDREARAELDRLSRAVSAGERDTQLLAARLETAERELAEAEQAAAGERGEAQRVERAQRTELAELAARSSELQQLLEHESTARARAERALDRLGAVQRSARELLGSLADTVARLRDAATPSEPETATAPATPATLGRAPAAPKAQPRPAPGSAGEAQAGEIAESLAVAFERLRARVELQERAFAAPAPPRETRPPHKHSMSLIGRARLAMRRRSELRKQRRAA